MNYTRQSWVGTFAANCKNDIAEMKRLTAKIVDESKINWKQQPRFVATEIFEYLLKRRAVDKLLKLIS